MTIMGRKLAIHFCRGFVPYRRALAWQRRLQEIAFDRGNAASQDTLLLVQHPSIFTLGRRSTLDNLRFDHAAEQGIDIIRVERGGEVTWHGPGQLVGYPIFDLEYHKKDLHWFLRGIEQVIIDTLADYTLTAERDDAGTGVWVGDSKIAAIGLSASKWVTMHGFSINVNPDLNDFQRIVPCGIEGRTVTTLDRLVPGGHRGKGGSLLEEVGMNVGTRFGEHFGMELDWSHGPPEIIVPEEEEIHSFDIVRNNDD